MNLANLLRDLPRLRRVLVPTDDVPEEDQQTLQHGQQTDALLADPAFSRLMERLDELRARYLARLRTDDDALDQWRAVDLVVEHIRAFASGEVEAANEYLTQLEELHGQRRNYPFGFRGA